MHIAANKEEATSYIQTRIDEVKIFSDGLGHKGKIGTAAIIPDTHDALQFQLGSIR
jgi:hypothetical protein